MKMFPLRSLVQLKNLVPTKSYTLLILSVVVVNTKLLPPTFEVPKPMQEYLSKTNVGLPGLYNTVGITGTWFENTKVLSSWFISNYIKEYPVIIGNYGVTIQDEYVAKTKNIFSLMNNYTNYTYVLLRLKNYRFYDQEASIQFVIGAPVTEDSETWLEVLLKDIWQAGYLNFVVVYCLNNHVNVIGYNPFKKSLLNFTESFRNKTLYPDKLGNLYGYEMNVSMFPDVPRNSYHASHGFVGEDASALSILAYTRNITVNVIKCADFTETLKFLKNGTAEFAMNKYFVVKVDETLSFSNPITMDDVILCVPKGKVIPYFLYIFLSFDLYLWLGIIASFFLTLLITTTITILHNKPPLQSFILTTGTIFRILLGVPLTMDTWHHIVTSARIMLSHWIFFSLIIATAFNCSLTRILVTTKYEEDIVTFTGINESSYNIYALDFIADIAKSNTEMTDKFLSATIEEIIDLMIDQNVDNVFAMSTTFVKNLVKQRQFNGRLVYNKIEDHLVPGYSVYAFKSKSPFTEMVDEFLKSDLEFGLSLYQPDNYRKELLTKENNNLYMALTVGHLQSAFIILLFGNLLGLFLLIVELISTLHLNVLLKRIKKR